MKKLITTVLLMALCHTATFASIWRVNNVNPNANFQTLDAAMDSVAIGDTIYLEGSAVNYELSNPITKSVTIIGPGYFLSENPTTLQYQIPATIKSASGGTIRVSADNCVFEGVTFVPGVGTSYLHIAGNNITLRRCRFSSVRIDVSDGTPTNHNYYNLTIMQCYLEYGVTLTTQDRMYNALICNNIIPGNNNISGFYSSTIENNTMVGSQSAAITSNNGCTIRNNFIRQTSSLSTGNTSCNIDSNYVYQGTSDLVPSAGTSTDGEYQMSPTSPGMTAGMGNSQCGAFGGVTPYILSGLPNIPHIYEIEAPSAGSADSGLPVIIRIMTEND